jgi:hypothetical protein
VHERLAGARPAERPQRAGDRLQLDAEAGAALAQRRAGALEPARHALGAGERDQRRGARQRDRAQQRRHLRTEAAARDEPEPLHAVRELPEEHHRDAAAERVPDHGRAPDPQRGQQIADDRRVRAQRVVAAGGRRVAVADEVGRDHRVALGQLERHLPPVP